MITALPPFTGVGTGASANVIPAVETNTIVRINRATVNNTTGGTITFTATANSPTARDVISAKPLTTLRSDQCPELAGMQLGPGQSLDLNLPAGVTYWISATSFVQ